MKKIIALPVVSFLLVVLTWATLASFLLKTIRVSCPNGIGQCIGSFIGEINKGATQ